jgi:hypothetical protein
VDKRCRLARLQGMPPLLASIEDRAKFKMATWQPSWILGGTGFWKEPSASTCSKAQHTKQISGKSEQVFLRYSMETTYVCTDVCNPIYFTHLCISFSTNLTIHTFLGRPKFVNTKHEVRYRSAHLYLVGFKFDHQNVNNVITTCMFSSIIRQNLGHDETTSHKILATILSSARLTLGCCVYMFWR